jgi:dihydroorotase-like cyclic amidohydrolase
MTTGEDANIVVFDPSVHWTVSRDHLESRASNTPYDGRALTGKVRALVAKGALVVHEGALA